MIHKPIKTVLLDLDGVCINFTKRCLEMHNRTIDWDAPENKGVADMPSILKISTNAFWKPINTEEFWESLEWMPDGKEILALCEKYTDNICLLTSPSAKPSACSGKAAWILKHMPDYRRKFLIGACKEYCAHANAHLIDDRNENVDTFRQWGGNALLLPRPWNRNYNLRTLEVLDAYLRVHFTNEI